MLTDNIVKKFLKTFDKVWWMKPPLGLVSPYFPTTFNPSGGHDLVRPIILNTEPQQLKNFFTVERCFRDIDVGMVGLSHHLSFFEMMTFGMVGYLKESMFAVEEVVKQMAHLLFETFSLDRKKVFVAYFNGGQISGIYVPPPIKEELEIWNKYFQINLVPIPGRRTFIYSSIEDWPAGPGYEIFYDRGENFPESIRFIEIASVNFYKYINHYKTLKEATNWAIGGGIGVERLAMIIQQTPTIYDIDIFKSLKKTLFNHTNQKEVLMFCKSYNIILDHLRSIAFILMDGQKIDSTPRGKILRKLIKSTINQLTYLNLLDMKFLDNFYKALVDIYKIRYPQIEFYNEIFNQTIRYFLTPEMTIENDEN
jgi:alanyl-tRNA synthetase